MREETRLIRQYLRDKAIAGEDALYSEIDKVAGWKAGTTQGKRRGVLSTALKWLEDEHGYASVCITTKGYRFLRGDAAIVTHEQIRSKKIVAQVGKFADTVTACAADASPEKLAEARVKLDFMEWALDCRTQYQLEVAAHRALQESRVVINEDKQRQLWAMIE